MRIKRKLKTAPEIDGAVVVGMLIIGGLLAAGTVYKVLKHREHYEKRHKHLNIVKRRLLKGAR